MKDIIFIFDNEEKLEKMKDEILDMLRIYCKIDQARYIPDIEDVNEKLYEYRREAGTVDIQGNWIT